MPAYEFRKLLFKPSKIPEKPIITLYLKIKEDEFNGFEAYMTP